MEPTTNAQSTPPIMPKTGSNKSQFITPIAIIVAGALIAFALYVKNPTAGTGIKGSTLVNDALAQPTVEVAPVSSVDHIRGDKDADVIFIEYSDIECPFCQLYQTTMIQAYDEYGKDKKFAWVYRHFPLSYGNNPLHRNAAKAAEATECAAELGGEEVFWKYLDAVYASINHQVAPLNMSTLPDIAAAQGIDKAKFKACLDSGKYAAKIKESYDAGVKAGAQGTPYTIIAYKDQNIPLISAEGKSLGAIPFEVVARIVEELLAKK